jgi:hypothetical protein
VAFNNQPTTRLSVQIHPHLQLSLPDFWKRNLGDITHPYFIRSYRCFTVLVQIGRDGVRMNNVFANTQLRVTSGTERPLAIIQTRSCLKEASYMRRGFCAASPFVNLRKSRVQKKYTNSSLLSFHSAFVLSCNSMEKS